MVPEVRRLALQLGFVLGSLACGGDVCSTEISAAQVVLAKFQPCLASLADAGFTVRVFDAGAAQASCEQVINGMACSPADRAALGELADTSYRCVSSIAACNPNDALAFYAAGNACSTNVADSGVSATCSSAVSSLSF